MPDSHDKDKSLEEKYEKEHRQKETAIELLALVYNKVKAMRDGRKFYLSNTIPQLYGANTLDDPKVPKYAANIARALGDMEKTIDIYESAQVSGGLTVDSLRRLEEAIANDGKIKDGKKMVDYTPHTALKHIWKEFLERKASFDADLRAYEEAAVECQARIAKSEMLAELEKGKRVRAEMDSNDLRKSLDEIISELKSELGEDEK